ncbi:transposase domain-containing protein [Sinorhizobium medicae]|uniref:transposase domain-containing protein n=1 Tax=Sinorhizobium medicae TaxID=110321 RepID=UPI000418E050|nr:transposase domain-containing protein [Sinorhizobium medicae]RVQ76143.1 transposase [Sinorhizobium medicae]
MKEWFSLEELAAAKLPGMPSEVAGLHKRALREGWRFGAGTCRQVSGRTKPVWQYHVSLLPAAARSKLAFLHADLGAGERPGASKMLWARFEALSDEHKAICSSRLETLHAFEELQASGISSTDAVRHCCRKADISKTTLYEWRRMVDGHAREDWLAALAPSFPIGAKAAQPNHAACHPDAWEALKADYLRLEQPGFSACYRRMVAAGKKHGWAPIPSERSLRRRMDAQVPQSVQILARKGEKEAKKLYPAQVRSKAHLHAMQLVNTDGHKLDLFVKVPWQEEPARLFIMGMQDVYSGKILSWRLTPAETWEVVRFCIGDMVEAYGIPEDIYMDNGRAFASKKISGGACNRHRFKSTEEEAWGLLKTLGIEPHFTTPYSGQSKPIERSWKDLAEEISRHPAMAGCYTGPNPQEKPENYGKRSVPLNELQGHVAHCIAEHNERPGRKSETAKGRSFDETFAASMADPATIVRRPTAEQRSLWLLPSEPVKARKPDGAVHHLGNIYWAPELNQLIGRMLTIRFDPRRLHDPVKVYDAAGRFVCDAACRGKDGFNDTEAAKRHGALRRAHTKAIRAEKEAATAFNEHRLQQLYAADGPPPVPEPVRPAVTRLITRPNGNLVRASLPACEADEDDLSESFSKALRRAASASILEFPKGDAAEK